MTGPKIACIGVIGKAVWGFSFASMDFYANDL